MDYWQYVSQVPHDGDSTYLEGSYGTFNVNVANVALGPGERIVAVAAALCWRNSYSAFGQGFLRVGAAMQSTNSFYVPPTYDTNYVLARTVPGTTRAWLKADLDVALVGGNVNGGYGLRCTQAGLHVLLHTPPVVPLEPKEQAMNFQAMEPLTANGSDQPVEVPRGATLVVHPLAANVEVRDVAGGTAKLTIPADSMVMLGPSYGQTVYLKATAGTVIELAVT
ncbi:MAG: hypothetical protein KBG29_17205 [Pseudomonadales bacterium]|nr:hypothetical protein [Pseudomonadales bacterium]